MNFGAAGADPKLFFRDESLLLRNNVSIAQFSQLLTPLSADNKLRLQLTNNAKQSGYSIGSLAQDPTLTNTKRLEVWNVDWIVLDQLILVTYICVTTIFSLASALLRKRVNLLISILLHLAFIAQSFCLLASDDRDFPVSIFRDGYSVTRHALLYTQDSAASLAFKILFLCLWFAHYTLLIVYYSYLRFDQLYAELALQQRTS